MYNCGARRANPCCDPEDPMHADAVLSAHGKNLSGLQVRMYEEGDVLYLEQVIEKGKSSRAPPSASFFLLWRRQITAFHHLSVRRNFRAPPLPSLTHSLEMGRRWVLKSVATAFLVASPAYSAKRRTFLGELDPFFHGRLWVVRPEIGATRPENRNARPSVWNQDEMDGGGSGLKKRRRRRIEGKRRRRTKLREQ